MSIPDDARASIRHDRVEDLGAANPPTDHRGLRVSASRSAWTTFVPLWTRSVVSGRR
jgi:hypothetical protein